METTQNTINIRPTTSVYATYQRLSYKPWYAIAEFVDNSTQSYFQNRNELQNILSNYSLGPKLTVEIIYDSVENTLTIFDNAYGMEMEDFRRAIILDSPPKDHSGRSEFGMGLKTAACWFGSNWTVESTRLGSERTLMATIDVNDLVKSKAESIVYAEKKVEKDKHFTRITIRDVHNPIRGRTINRVHEHLCSIYRQDLRSGEVKLLWNGVPLTFDDPHLYEEIDSNGNDKLWKKELNFYVPWTRNNTELKVNGWIGIRKQGKQRDAGFVLMRRGRVILGGPGEGYKPSEVFGQANSFRSQRLIGELHLDDWPVTQAKDGFDWSGGLEDSLIDILQELCKEFGDKSESIRAQQSIEPVPVSAPEMETVSKETKKILQDGEFSKWVQEEINKGKRSESIFEPKENYYKTENVEDGIIIDDDDLLYKSTGPVEYTLNLDKTTWTFRLYWLNNVTESFWMSVEYPKEDEINIYLNLSHPFFSNYVNDQGILELLQKFVISIGLAEKMARMSSNNSDNYIDPADLRTLMNKILTKISSIRKVD